MTEQQLRSLVREAIARHHAGAAAAPAAPVRVAPSGRVLVDPAHATFRLEPDPSGACVIEPTVQCDHCGYCKSYGH